MGEENKPRPIPIDSKRNRRGWGKKLKRKQYKSKQNEENFSIFASNANGIKGKFDSLLSNIKYFGASCAIIQESKLRFPGTIKIEGYEIFENIREGLGGGLLTAIDKSVNPVLISSGCEYFEALIVQVKVGSKNLRVFNCYGPQESGQAQRPVNEQITLINLFWQELEKEVINAYDDVCMILIEMDANAKIGWTNIKKDPNDTSENGHLLLDMVQRQSLKILNCSPKCEGVISRQRETVDRVEQSVIDYVVTCEEMSSYLQNMMIDDQRKYVLTKFSKQNGRGKNIESDHNPIFVSFNLTYNVKKPVHRREIFDFKSKEGQKKYFNVTSLSSKFSSCFNSSDATEQNVNRYFKTLDDILHQCFDKIRIKSQVPSHKKNKSEIQVKIEERSNLKASLTSSQCKLLSTIIEQKIQDIDEFLSEQISERNAKKITEQISELSLGWGRGDFLRMVFGR